MQRFTIGDMSQDEGLQVMTESAHASLVPFDLRAVDRKRDVGFDLVDRRFADLGVAHMTIENIVSERTESLAKDSSPPHLSVMIPHGTAYLEQSGRRFVGAEGSVSLTWSLDPWATTVCGPVDLHSVTVPLDRIHLPHSVLGEVVGRDLGGTPLGGTIRAYIREIAGMPELPTPQSDAIAQPTVDLIRALVSTAAGEAAAELHLSQTIGTRVMMHLRTHATDPELSADTLAARFSISRRYLYLILADRGVSLGDWIRTERLRHAAALLREPRQREVTVSEVARLSGFRDHSTFSRAFRAHYGCTPTEWRNA